MKVIEDEDGIRIVFAGEIDHHAAGGLLREMAQLIDRRLPNRCTLDFAQVTFMDSSGIAVVMNAYRRVRELGGSVRLVGVNTQARKVLAAAGLDRMMPIL